MSGIVVCRMSVSGQSGWVFLLGVPHAKDDDPFTDDLVDPPGPFITVSSPFV